ncbi:MAG: molybdopterin-dependent oxidoreductase, partial [Nitrososphaerales archaeon]
DDTPIKPHLQRRLLLRGSLLSASAVGVALLLYGLLPFTSSTPVREDTSSAVKKPTAPASDLTGIFEDPRLADFVDSEVTSNKDFYKIQVNIFDPVVDVNKWSLKIKGLVDKELELTYDDILSLPSKEQFTTLECISNEIGGELIGNALWKGPSLKEVLDMAGVKREAVYLKFTNFDGYWVGIPINKAMMESTILAYQMNGETLSAGHGFPLRAVVPGIYGMMNAKWITEIELEPEVVQGFWQERGWSNDAQIMTNVIIKKPTSGSRFSGAMPISGVAFAGDRGISRVEVSANGGETWTEAAIKKPLSDYSWVLWATEWVPPGPGAYQIWARATDGTGSTQTEKVMQPFPDGATGYHKVNVRVQ